MVERYALEKETDAFLSVFFFGIRFTELIFHSVTTTSDRLCTITAWKRSSRTVGWDVTRGNPDKFSLRWLMFHLSSWSFTFLVAPIFLFLWFYLSQILRLNRDSTISFVCLTSTTETYLQFTRSLFHSTRPASAYTLTTCLSFLIVLFR